MVLFIQRRNTIIIWLCGGDKATQAKDILRAHVLSEQVEEQTRNEIDRESAWDAAMYFETDGDMAGCFDAALEGNEPALNTAPFGDIARAWEMSRIAE
jgi:hypothetical protein